MIIDEIKKELENNGTLRYVIEVKDSKESEKTLKFLFDNDFRWRSGVQKYISDANYILIRSESSLEMQFKKPIVFYFLSYFKGNKNELKDIQPYKYKFITYEELTDDGFINNLFKDII